MAEKIPLVDLKAQYQTIRPAMDTAILKFIEKQAFILGKPVDEFEKAYSEFTGGGFCAGCSSGTDALVLILQAMGIGIGDEVVIPTQTFIATAEAVSMVGAKPVFADVDNWTGLISPDTILAALTVKTKAVIAVHLYGRPAPLASLKGLCVARGIKLIEDAAQAHGATSDAGPVGLVGDAAAFSFFPGKNLGAYGDAGAVTSRDEDLIRRIRKLRNHGRTFKYEHDIVGRNCRIDALQAVILSVKLPYLSGWTRKRRQGAVLYRKLLDGVANIDIAGDDPGHVYHLFTVGVDRRDEVIEDLKNKGIEAGIHYPIPLHLQPAYAHLGYKKGSFPNAEIQSSRTLSLPLYPEISETQICRVAETLIAAL